MKVVNLDRKCREERKEEREKKRKGKVITAPKPVPSTVSRCQRESPEEPRRLEGQRRILEEEEEAKKREGSVSDEC